jgi:hypothetical protein
MKLFTCFSELALVLIVSAGFALKSRFSVVRSFVFISWITLSVEN